MIDQYNDLHPPLQHKIEILNCFKWEKRSYLPFHSSVISRFKMWFVFDLSRMAKAKTKELITGNANFPNEYSFFPLGNNDVLIKNESSLDNFVKEKY